MKLALQCVAVNISISFHISLAIFSLNCFRFVSDGQIYDLIHSRLNEAVGRRCRRLSLFSIGLDVDT